MFNWFKKNAVTEKVAPESGVAAIQDGDTIIPLAKSESVAFKDRGNAYLNNGKLEEAAVCFRQAIERNPCYAEAYTNLGLIFQMQGNLDEAIALYRKAVVYKPELLTAHMNLGIALMNLGQDDAAEESFRRVIALDSGYVAALQSLGVIAFQRGTMAAQRGDFPHAEILLRRALELQPDYAEAHFNLGILLAETKRQPEAEASCRRALELKPDYPEAHYSLGTLLMGAKRLPEAEAFFHRALELKPDYADAHINLGLLLAEARRLPEAETSFRRALELQPDYAEAHFGLGNLFEEAQRLPEAEASFRRALALKPNYAEAYINLSNTLKDLGRLNEAEACCQRALEIKPDYAEAHNNMGNTLQSLGRLADAEASFRRALQINPNYAEAYSNLLFSMNYTSNNVFEYLEEACRYGRMVTKKVGVRFSSWQCMDNPVRLRVGLVSGDFCQHPVGFFLEGLLSNIGPARFELYAYPTRNVVDELTARIKPFFAAWKPLFGQSDEAAARMIHADGVHILIDLSGHTAHNRLPVFAWKPAPVQVSWLGYFATTGVEEIDYLIADRLTLPEGEEANYTEKIWYLPETRLCFTAPDADVPVSRLPALTNGHVTFACFNNLSKMNDAVVTLWARILAAVPGSRLFLKAGQLADPSIRQNVIERFAAHGVGADQLILEGFVPRADYLVAYHRVDIALDPFPYSGGTTSAESLWMGVPVLTLAGDHVVSRQGVGLLTNAGLPEWIAADADDYVARAVLHAGDLERLATLRDGLRQQVLASPIFDAPRFARHFESALGGIWEKWCERHDVGHPGD